MNMKPEWLQDWQQQKLAEFNAVGYPTRHDEEWKYTNVAAIVEQNFVDANGDHLSSTPEFLDDCYRIVFLNGHFSADLSVMPNDDSLKISTWQQAFARNPECIREFFEKFNQVKETPFTLLNQAHFNDGVVIRVKENCKISKRICLHYLKSAEDKPAASHIHNLISAGKNSEFNLFEQFESMDNSEGFCNLVTNIWLSENAKMDYVKIQKNNSLNLQTASLAVVQERDSVATTYHVTFGGKLIRDDLHFLLNGTGARCQSYGFYHVTGNQHYDCHSRIDHLVSNTHSTQLYKGIIEDKARAVFNGKVIVSKNAQKAEAYQKNNNLLLSKSAEINTKPELEIYADDVKCAHGATVGQLDPEALFYLRSRGLTEVDAKKLLTKAFANEILQALDVVMEFENE